MIDGKHIKIVLALFVISSFVSTASLAEEEKSYTITNLKTLVSNSKNCFPLFKDLKRAFKKPITLTFNKINDTDFTASEKNNTISNTSFKIIKEDIGNNTLHRLGIGSFEVGQKKVDYVLEVSASTTIEKFKYTYPIILSDENARCYYMAMIHPTKETIDSLKKHIKSGKVKEGSDLTND